MAISTIPTITLNNGLKFPRLGLGTWQSEPGEVESAIKIAIDCGYRHIDCAFVYKNEKEIGNAIHDKIADGTVKREDLFIVSKVWNTSHRPDLVIPACKKSLQDLGLDYLDLYLIHWPFAYKEDQTDLFPSDDKGKILFSNIDYLDTWIEMEKCFELGLTKSLGISNFNSKQITRLLSVAKIKPVVNQIEVHPNLNQKKLIEFCKDQDIAITAYSPFGSPARPWAKPGDPVLHMDDPKLLSIAEKYKKSTAQVILRYLIDIGTVPIPKSANKERIKQNIDIFDFKLDEIDINIIDTFNCNGRVCTAEGMENHKYYPFNIEY